MTDKQLTEEELAEQFLIKLMKDDPVKCVMWMLVQLGREAVACNAQTMTLSQESDIEGIRYNIKTVVTMKKVKSLQNKQS